MSLGFTEILLILVVILLLFGGKRIPELARSLGRASYEFKKAKDAIKKETEELKNSIAESEEKPEENDTVKEDNSRLYRRKSKKRIFAVSAIVIAAVIVLNVAFSALTSHELWFADLTYTRYKSNPSSFYRMTDVFKNLIEDEAIPMIDGVNEEREAAGEDPIKL